MHIDLVPNRKARPTVLLRESFRQGKKVRKRTLANLSSLSLDQVQLLRQLLRGEPLARADTLFETVRSTHHGHVQAVQLTMQRLGFASLLASRPSRERDLVCAMVTAQIVEPDSKLAMTRWWHTTTLPESLGVVDATADDCYAAMDWLLRHQSHIETKLAARHLTEGGLVLYDLTSSYFEGTHCPLAAFGHNRDGKKGKRQVNYGVLTDAQGRPVAVSVFEGNAGDPTTLLSQVQKVQEDFGITELVLVGDRGMITQTQIDTLQDVQGLAWITALKTGAIRELIKSGALQLGLFDEHNLFELTHPDFPKERFVACRNPELARLRVHKRQALLAATTKELEQVLGMVMRGTLKGQAAIGVRVGKVVNKYKVAKHFTLEIREDHFGFQINEAHVAEEATLDGIYVIRTSVSSKRLSRDDTVRSYKFLTQLERAFRCMKTLTLEVRPIRHWAEDRVRAHLLLCLLAYYVLWHMIEAWRPLLFADEDQAAKLTRDPVAPASRSERALDKVGSKRLEDGTEAHSVRTLLKDLSTIVRNVCRRPGAPPDEPLFPVVTLPNAKQQRALDLLEAITV